MEKNTHTHYFSNDPKSDNITYIPVGASGEFRDKYMRSSGSGKMTKLLFSALALTLLVSVALIMYIGMAYYKEAMLEMEEHHYTTDHKDNGKAPTALCTCVMKIRDKEFGTVKRSTVRVPIVGEDALRYTEVCPRICNEKRPSMRKALEDIIRTERKEAHRRKQETGNGFFTESDDDGDALFRPFFDFRKIFGNVGFIGNAGKEKTDVKGSNVTVRVLPTVEDMERRPYDLFNKGNDYEKNEKGALDYLNEGGKKGEEKSPAKDGLDFFDVIEKAIDGVMSDTLGSADGENDSKLSREKSDAESTIFPFSGHKVVSESNLPWFRKPVSSAVGGKPGENTEVGK